MDLDGLRALQRVVGHGSFQGAAKAHRTSLARLRRQVRALEASIGAPLLRRGATGVEPTPAGVEALERATDLLGAASDLVAAARSAADEPAGELRLLAPVGLPAAPRAAGMRWLARHAPDLRVLQRELEDPRRHIDEPFDLLMHFGEPPARDSLRSRVVMRIPLRLQASPAWLQEHGEPSLEQVATAPLLMWRHPDRAGDRVALRGGGELTVRPRLVTPNLQLLLDLAAAGAGILFGPHLPESRRDRSLVPVVDAVGGTATLRALTRRPRRDDSRVHAMSSSMDRLVDHLIAARRSDVRDV